MPLLVVGSIALDTIRTPDGREHRDVLGGSCTYFSCAASYLAPVRLVGVVGEDFAARHVRLLEKRNIDLAGLERVKGGKTFRWAGTYAKDMNTRTTDDLQFGVLGGFDPVLPPAYRTTPHLFLACAQPELQLKVMDQMKGRPLTVADTIEHYIQTARKALDKVLRRVDGVILNDSEARLLTGEHNLVRAGKALLRMGPRFAVVKKGEHGGLLSLRDGIFPFPAFPLETVKDPTGAGDSFAGGFLGWLAKTRKAGVRDLRRAAAWGTVMASFTCEGVSLSRIAALRPAEIRARAAAYGGMLRIA